MTLLQVHGACFDGATSLEQPELIANEGAALSALGPQQSAMQRQEERTGVGEKLENGNLGFLQEPRSTAMSFQCIF
jgi:hypothetical protein